MTYHVGLIRGTGNCPCWANGHRSSTVIVQMRRNLDLMDPGLWRYMGERVTTKAATKAKKAALLAAINERYGSHFTHIVID